MTFFIALFYRAQLAQIPAMFVAIVLATGLAYAVRFWLISDHPSRALRQTTYALLASIAVVLRQLADLALAPRRTRRNSRQIHAATDRLRIRALIVDGILSDLAPRTDAGRELRERILALQLTAERVVFATRQIVRSGALPDPARLATREALLSARDFGRGRAHGARDEAERALARAAALAEASADPARATDDARRVRTSLTDLLEVAAWFAAQRRNHSIPESPAAVIPAFGGPALPDPKPEQMHPTTRLGIQASLAGTLAMVAGYLVSSARWYWAVIAAFVVFIRTSTRADTLERAWPRVVGTVLGVEAGIFVADLVGGHPRLELVVLFACIFFAYYLFQVSYLWLIFWITVLLAVLYRLLGRFTPGLMYLRLAETVIGSIIGVIVAATVLPSRAGARLRALSADVLRSASSYLRAAVAERANGRGDAELLGQARELDGKLQRLQDSAKPTMGAIVRIAPGSARIVQLTSGLVLAARQLMPGEPVRRLDDSERRAVSAAGEQLAGNATAVAEALERREAVQVTPAAAGIERARAALSGESAVRRGPSSPPVWLYWLERVDAVIAELGRMAGPAASSANR